MSNGKAFWAAGKEIVTSANNPTSVITDAPPKVTSEPITQQRKGLFLKSKTNGRNPSSLGMGNGNGVALATPVSRKTCWADEEEDEIFLSQFVTRSKKSVVAGLETKILVEEERVKELETTLATKALRIAELEGGAQERDAYIDDLENDIQKKNDDIEGLKKENHEQYLEIQELHYEVLGKDDQIRRLEAKLEQVSTTQDIKSSIPHTDSSTKTNVTKVSSETIGTPQAEPPLPETPRSTEIEGTVDTQKTEITRGPSFCDTNFPTFVTKETLKEVPPVPKAKILAFPIDFSKYGKKPATSPSLKPARSSVLNIAKNGHTTPWGQSSKQSRTKTNVKPAFNTSADIRHMSHGERVLYANGPDIVVKLASIELKIIPKYILMQCSARAMDYFQANPNATSWSFPAGSMDADAARSLLNWMEEMTYQGRVYSITLNTSPANDEKNIRICRAARVLGLNNCYVGHFTKQLCDRIRSKDVTYAFMNTICELAYPENDPVFDCLANNLVNQKMNGSAADKAGLEKLVAGHPVLKTKMDKIEQKMRSARSRK